ncbi:hypothetical protein FA95DRAFT_926766 [Auriscalpium vulgare]|uniref:Uncharacterized protein n=1 Tax=Auriscalpium vulgare TaxID=40419 RepID=A0ACB8R7I8_9AGAM|nr:hypothetical protein FA95DRAFT_926766 [Auriscalpium vulgare]
MQCINSQIFALPRPPPPAPLAHNAAARGSRNTLPDHVLHARSVRAVCSPVPAPACDAPPATRVCNSNLGEPPPSPSRSRLHLIPSPLLLVGRPTPRHRPPRCRSRAIRVQPLPVLAATSSCPSFAPFHSCAPSSCHLRADRALHARPAQSCVPCRTRDAASRGVTLVHSLQVDSFVRVVAAQSRSAQQ